MNFVDFSVDIFSGISQGVARARRRKAASVRLRCEFEDAGQHLPSSL